SRFTIQLLCHVSLITSSESRQIPAIEPLFRLVPADDVPPGGDIVWPAVLILEVIGVLPYIQADDRIFAFHDRAVLVGGGGDGDFVAILHQPRPAGAEAARRRRSELFLKLIERAEGGVDGGR